MIGALILNGEPFHGDIAADTVVCCDGGYRNYRGKCDLLIGDMDSLDAIPDVPYVKLDPIKNETDGEAGLDYLIGLGVSEVVVYGVAGGRLDHILTNVGLLARGVRQGIRMRAAGDTYDAYMANSKFAVSGVLGKTISLVPFCDKVHILYTKGLFYPLKEKTLDKASSLAISNVATEDAVEIGIDNGECLIVVNR